MAGSSQRNAAAQRDTGPSSSAQPGQASTQCPVTPPAPVLAQQVTPTITVNDPMRWFHATVEPEKNQIGSVLLQVTKTGDELGYKEDGKLQADSPHCEFFTDAACKKKIKPGVSPVKFKFGSLAAGVTLYYKGASVGFTKLTLTMGPPKDGRITVQGPAEGSTEAREVSVLQPKLELEYKVVLLDCALHGQQAGHEVPIRTSAVYVEATATHSDAAKPCTSTGQLVFAPAHVSAFLDEACTQALNRNLTMAELTASPPLKVWLRGTAEGKFQAKLNLSDPQDASIRVVKNPTPDQEMGVLKLSLKLHHHTRAQFAGAGMQVDPDTDKLSTYHSALQKKKLPDPLEMTAAQKVGQADGLNASAPGRLLHVQANGHHARAKLVLGKIDAAALPAGAQDYTVPLRIGRGWARSGSGTTTLDLQGGAADTAPSGSMAFFSAETGGQAVADPHTTLGALKSKDQTFWLEGQGETDGVCDLRVDAGLDRGAGGLAKKPKRNGDWARATVVRIQEVKLEHTPPVGLADPWDAARHEYSINLVADPNGRKIRLAATLSKKLSHVDLHFMLAPHEHNRQKQNWGVALPGTWKWSALTAGVKHLDKTDRKDFLHLCTQTDANGKAVQEVRLSRFGGDRFRPAAYVTQDAHLAKYVSGHAQLGKRQPALAAHDLIVMRRFWYQMVQVTGVVSPNVNGAIGQYERVKARMEAAAPLVVNPAPNGSIYPRYMVDLQGDGSNALLVSNLNKLSFFTGFAAEADKPVKVPLLICDAQWDTGPNTSPINGDWRDPGTIVATADRLLIKPALDGGNLLVSGSVECIEPDGAGGWLPVDTFALSEADLSITNPRGSLRRVSVAMPAAVTAWCSTRPEAQVRIVNLVMKGARGPYLGESFAKKVLAVYDPTEAADFQNTIAHELGHGFKQTLEAGEQPAGAPNLPTQYISFDSDGVATGSHCKHAKNKCVMYESGPIQGSLNRFCDVCHPYLLSLDMHNYG